MMKILIIGSNKVYAIENHYVTHLRELGVEIVHFPAQTLFYDYYRRDLVNKILFKTGLSRIYQKINDAFKEVLNEHRPDCVWVFKGMEIFPDSLRYAKSRNVRLINFNPDNPFVFSGKGSGNKNVTNSISLYDLHLTYDHEILHRLEQLGLTARYLPFAFELSQKDFNACQEECEVLQICFLGNPDDERAEFIYQLAGHGVQICVYGHGWGKFIRHNNVEIHDAVYGIEQWRILRKYRAQLNLMRPHNPHSHNMRTFEVPAVGGIMLAARTSDHETFFSEGKEVFLFKNVNECAELMKSLLALPKEGADEIRRAARDRSLSCGYDYKHRAAQALTEIENIK